MRPTRFLHPALSASVVVVLLICGAAILVFPEALLLPAWFEWPWLGVIGGAVAFAVFIVVSGQRPWLGRGAATLALLYVWLAFRTLPLGDEFWWRRAAENDVASVSELLSSATYRWISRTWGSSAIEWISPALGVLTLWCWFRLTDRLVVATGEADRPYARRLLGLVWLASVASLLFFSSYIEHSQLGLPFLLLALGQLRDYAVHVAMVGPDGRWRRLLPAAVLFAIAAMCHLQYAGMFAVLVVGIVSVNSSDLRRALADTLAVVVVSAAIAAAAVAVVLLSGIEIHAGNVTGGADQNMFLPFGQGSAPGAAASLNSVRHLADVGNILLLAAPLVVMVPLTLLHGRRHWRHWTSHTENLVFSAAAFAYLAFVLLYQFDLGFPLDIDLMVAMSLPLSAWVGMVLLHSSTALGRVGRLATLAAVGLVAVVPWCWFSGLIRPSGESISQRNSPNASLTVDRPAAGIGPITLRIAPGTAVTLEVRGPAGATCWIVESTPHPENGGAADIGIVDIEVPVPLADLTVVFMGLLDDEGLVRVPYVVRLTTDGQMPALQAIVGQLPGGRGVTLLTAAVYFVRQ